MLNLSVTAKLKILMPNSEMENNATNAKLPNQIFHCQAILAKIDLFVILKCQLATLTKAAHGALNKLLP